MTKTAKKHPAVAAAEQHLEVAALQLKHAEAEVSHRRELHAKAIAAVREAQIVADADLPQCRMVRVAWRSGTETDMGRVVILRKTPGGVIVTREVGRTDGAEFRFSKGKWPGAEYSQDEKRNCSVSDHRELRDVPPEFA